MTTPNPVPHWLAEAEASQIQNWLGHYLRGDDVIPALPVPSTHRSRATYLADLLSGGDTGTARRSGDALLALLDEWGKRVDGPGGRPPAAEAEWACAILSVLQALTVTNPDQAVAILDRLRRKQEWKEWPSRKEDLHRQVLLALASQLRNTKSASHSLPEALIEEELADPRYSSPAWIALATIAPQTAATFFPVTARILKKKGIAPDNLLLILNRLSGSSRQIWTELGRSLAREGNDDLIQSVDRAATRVLDPDLLDDFHKSLLRD